MSKTNLQYNAIIDRCRDVFVRKTSDYGTSWRIMRLGSVLDQIYIKANRIRTIEENGVKQIDEGVESEFAGIINYCIIALIQMELRENDAIELQAEFAIERYDAYFHTAKNLMLKKNHDYGEAWRQMQVSTFTDMLLMRIHRIRQILENDGKTQVSEGIDSNFYDMINYAVFALIKLDPNYE